jgi:hypothetical protein
MKVPAPLVLVFAAPLLFDVGRAGDIITRERFSEFELTFEVQLSAGANSGVKYSVQPVLPAITPAGARVAVGSAIGLEIPVPAAR